MGNHSPLLLSDNLNLLFAPWIRVATSQSHIPSTLITASAFFFLRFVCFYDLEFGTCDDIVFRYPRDPISGKSICSESGCFDKHSASFIESSFIDLFALTLVTFPNMAEVS
ncbi:Short-chain dehydrogenase chyC [Fusarium oxysporum f. sp. albedinis]|nr:Short-chain dehydrogenase chyC [Fusarium oxysporum f. sp. albedinis]